MARSDDPIGLEILQMTCQGCGHTWTHCQHTTPQLHPCKPARIYQLEKSDPAYNLYKERPVTFFTSSSYNVFVCYRCIDLNKVSSEPAYVYLTRSTDFTRPAAKPLKSAADLLKEI